MRIYAAACRIKPLGRSHHYEVVLEKEESPLNPRWQVYLSPEEAKLLVEDLTTAIREIQAIQEQEVSDAR